MNESIFLRRPDAEVGDPRTYHVEFEAEPFELHGRHHEIKDAEADVSVTKLAEGLYLDVAVRATVRTTCDRTLEDVDLPLEFGDSEFLEGPCDEELAIKDWTLDVKRYAERVLPTEVPMQVFAPGTEPVRSAEGGGEVDPRWRGLDGLFASGF